ncbi:hypothetical protein OU578_16645 [Escherichia coli]|uniref:hypothetical protein n=1 Tax=Enterobacter hormaechei TaxID=158836 RepID=UPI00131EE543|nr:hypothetical protein [Enterobacter hormaechei]MBH3111948.1 hypothetical protein [Serratia marcescens]MDF8979928.1 hypothetical protein [Escherichia coli]HAO0322999.1 hypothetical protein [Escherichia coli]
MSTYELLKTANEMTFTVEKILLLKEHLKKEERKFEVESKKRLVDEHLLSKSYEA